LPPSGPFLFSILPFLLILLSCRPVGPDRQSRIITGTKANRSVGCWANMARLAPTSRQYSARRATPIRLRRCSATGLRRIAFPNGPDGLRQRPSNLSPRPLRSLGRLERVLFHDASVVQTASVRLDDTGRFRLPAASTCARSHPGAGDRAPHMRTQRGVRSFFIYWLPRGAAGLAIRNALPSLTSPSAGVNRVDRGACARAGSRHILVNAVGSRPDPWRRPDPRAEITRRSPTPRRSDAWGRRADIANLVLGFHRAGFVTREGFPLDGRPPREVIRGEWVVLCGIVFAAGAIVVIIFLERARLRTRLAAARLSNVSLVARFARDSSR